MGQTADELRADIEQRRDNMSGTVDAIEDKVRPGRIIQRRRQAVRDWAGTTRERMMGTRDAFEAGVSDSAAGAAATVRDVGAQIAEAPTQLADQTRGAPLIAGGIALGLGALLALLLPETRIEHQAIETVQPQIDMATEAAKDAGLQALQTTQDSAKEAISDLKDSAAERATELAEQANEAKDEVVDRAQEATNSPAS